MDSILRGSAWLFVLFFLVTPQTLGEKANLALPRIKESQAYKNFKAQPHTEFSKLVYLIDRFKPSKIEIEYNQDHFKAAQAAPIVKLFLSKNYREGESAKDWILNYGSRTIPEDRLIWVVFPDGSKHLARDVLFQELNRLEETTSKDSKSSK